MFSVSGKMRNFAGVFRKFSTMLDLTQKLLVTCKHKSDRTIKKLTLRLSGRFPKGHQLYDGPYHGGHACYSYYTNSEGVRVFNGLFRFQQSYVNRDSCMVRSVARGSFKNGKKDGTWSFLYKEMNRKVRLTIDFVGGRVSGPVLYDMKEKDMSGRPARTKLIFNTFDGQMTGELKGLFRGNRFMAMVDPLGKPDGQWVSDRSDREHGEWQEVEQWSHGQLVQAERNMFAYGRKESMRPYMSQQVNMVIDSINHMMLTIVRHGSHGGLMYVQTA